MDCVEVCPVDCFYEGENMLVIKPDECIDCGVCEPECPIDAIEADTDSENNKKAEWIELNSKYSTSWPNITKKRSEDVPKDEEKWRGVLDKQKYLSEKPGKGD
jgi:Ferredoxin